MDVRLTKAQKHKLEKTKALKYHFEKFGESKQKLNYWNNI